MTKRLYRRALAPTHPFWMRALATACLLLVAFASTAQAVHIHGDWLPHHASQVEKAALATDQPGGEERCPLCQAMHSALPSAVRIVPVKLTLVAVKAVSVLDRLPDSQWHYARFSRPPPISNS